MRLWRLSAQVGALERQPSLRLSMDASNIPVSFDVSMSAGSSEATVAAKKASGATLSAKKMPRNFRALDKALRAKLFSDVPLPHLSIPSWVDAVPPRNQGEAARRASSVQRYLEALLALDASSGTAGLVLTWLSPGTKVKAEIENVAPSSPVRRMSSSARRPSLSSKQFEQMLLDEPTTPKEEDLDAMSFAIVSYDWEPQDECELQMWKGK